MAFCVLSTERSSYDASGFSFLASDPTATAAPRHPLVDLFAVGAVPFSDMHLESASESKGEGLSGWPAFSSVFTVMAGTVKHPVSFVQSRTSPTITRDDDHNTQWPSFSSSTSSTSSGLAKNMPNERVTPPAVSGPQHLFLMDRGNNMSMFSSPAASSPSVQSPLSFSPTTQLKTHSSQRQVIASRPLPQMESSTFALNLGWTNNTNSTQLTVVTRGQENTKPIPLQEILIRSSTEQSNTVDPIIRASEKYHSNTETKAAGSSHKRHLSLGVSDRAAGAQNPARNFLLANYHETSTLFPSDQESLHVQRQRGSSQNPTSAPLSSLPKAYSLSSPVTQQMSNRTKDETKVLTYTSVHKTQGKAIMTPFGSHAVNPSVTSVMFSTSQSFFTVTPATPSGKGSISEAVITNPAHILSSTGSLEHASNPDDLLMAAGHDGPKAPSIIMNYDQGETLGAEFTSISSQAYLKKSLFLPQAKPTKLTSPGAFSSLVSGVGSTSSLLSAPETLHLTPVTADQEFTTQTLLPMGIYQERRGYTTVKKTSLFQSWVMSLSSSELPAEKRLVTPLNKSELTMASAQASFENNDRRMPFTGSYVTQRGKAAESEHINTAKTSVPAILKKESTIYLNTFHKEVVTSTRSSFIATKDDVFNKSSGEKSQTPIPTQSFSATLEPPKSKADVTLMSRNRQSSSSWADIALTLRTNSTTGSQGPITSLKTDKSKFYLGRKTTIFSSASSAAATSFSDGQRSNAIFSFSTQPVAHYTKRKTSMIVPFQTRAFISETTSVAFDMSRSHLQTDATSDEHPNWNNEQQSNQDISTSYPPPAASLNSFNPKTERHLGISREQSVDLSSDYSTSFVSFTLNPVTSSDLGSGGFLPELDTAAEQANTSETSSTSPPLVLGVGFNNVLSFTHNHKVKDLKLKGLMSTLSSLQSPAPSSQTSSSSVITPPFLKGVTSFPFPLHIKPYSKSPEASSGLSLSTNKPTLHPYNTLSVSVKRVPSPLPFSSPTFHPDGPQEVTESFVVLTASGAGELTTATTTISFPKEKETSLSPSLSVVFAGATERTSQVLSLTPLRDTTTASVQFTTTRSGPDTTAPSLDVTKPFTARSTTARHTTTTRKPITTTTNRSQTNRRTLTLPVPRTSPPRWATTVFISPFTTTTETPPQQCNITERMWVKTGNETVLSNKAK